MEPLTKRQKQVLSFIESSQQAAGETPSLREIAEHFGFRSPNAARDHVRALVRKGALKQEPLKARALRVVSPLNRWRRPVADIPVYGAIPAGFGDDTPQDAVGCISVDVHTLGIRPTPRTFALRVRGDSMTGKHILDGDHVICEHGLTPKPGDVVAALIDNESTLKTFLIHRGKPYLKAENPKYPKLLPASELVVQGVVVSVLRQFKKK